MATRQPRGGRGSNQYGIKPRGSSVSDDENRAYLIEKMSKAAPTHSGTGMDRKTIESIDRLDTGVQNYFDRMSNEQLSQDEIVDMARDQSEVESEILDRYPYSYGQSLVNSVYSQYDTSINESDEPESVRLRQSYDQIHDDATGYRVLSPDERAQTLDTISEGERCRRGVDSSEEELRVEKKHNRLAAYTVQLDRDPSDQSTKKEVETLRRELEDDGISRIGL